MSKGRTEPVNHLVAKILSLVVSEHQDNGDELLPHAEPECNYSLISATDHSPNAVRQGSFPNLPLAVISRDQLEYCNLARERQHSSYQVVLEDHNIASSFIARANERLRDVLHKRSVHAIGSWGGGGYTII